MHEDVSNTLKDLILFFLDNSQLTDWKPVVTSSLDGTISWLLKMDWGVGAIYLLKEI